MKKKEKKLKGYLFLIPTYVILILSIMLPLFYSLIYTKFIDSSSFEVFSLILTVLFVLFMSFGIFETLFCMYHLYNNKKVEHNEKMILYVILFFFNIIFVPYYYHTYMEKNTKKQKNDKFKLYIIILIILLSFCVTSLIYSVTIYNDYKITEIKREKKAKEIKTEYFGKHETFNLTFKLGFKKEDVSEYDLYVIDENRNIMTGAFLYATENYEQKDGNSILDKQVEYLKENRKNIETYNKKETRKVDNKSIITIELSGNSDSSASSIYRLSTITFNNDNSKILYVIQTVLLEDYKKNVKELDEILDSATLK